MLFPVTRSSVTQMLFPVTRSSVTQMSYFRDERCCSLAVGLLLEAD